MRASYNGPFSNGLESHWCYHWLLQPGLWRALLRHVGAWILSLPDQMAHVLALLRPSGMVQQPFLSGQGANDQKTLCLPAEEVLLTGQEAWFHLSGQVAWCADNFSGRLKPHDG